MGFLTRIANAVPGSGPGRLRLTVTDTSGHDQLGLIAAIRCRHYDPAATARPIYGAEELLPLDAAAATTRVGALGGGVVRHSNLASSWTPVLELRKFDTTYLTHTGAYRLLVRAYSPDGSAVKLRAVWDVGDLVNPVENEFDIKQIPGANNFYLLDLGELRLDEVPVGTHRWTGQIQAKGAAGGEDVDLDVVTLLNTDEGYVKCRAPQLSATASQATYGPRSGGTFADDSGVGTVAWSNPSNAGAADTAIAVASLGASGTSHYLKATNFGFSIPSGSTINGIVVEVLRQKGSGGSTGVQDNAVRIVKGGTIQATDRSSASPWSVSSAYQSYGSATDLWGATWDSAAINLNTFGCAISANGTTGASQIANIDHIRVTVYYTPSTALPEDAVLFANQSAELSWRGHFREDSTGTAYGPISEQIGDLLRMPIAGSENRPVELTVVTSRGDLELLPDTGPDQSTLDGTVEPAFLYPPGS